MPKSLIRALAPNIGIKRNIPFPQRWNTQGGQLYGSGLQDRFTQLQAMSGTGTLFAIIQLLSTGSQATGTWKMMTKPRDGRVRYSSHDKGSDQRQEVLQHPALSLWNNPNPFMTGEQFREIGWQYMELVGEWYWVLNRGASGRGMPIEMWPVRPDRMEPVPDPKNFLAGWVYTGPNGEQVPLLASEVIQLKYPNPMDLYRGMSPVQALLADIDSAKYTAEWSRNFFLNSATPGGIVTFAKRLSDTEFKEFTDRWREQHQGVARGHRVGVLEQGATFDNNTYTMHDMQFVELRNLSREVIREAYRIHQAMLGNSEDVNRANAQTAEEIHVAWHEIPRLKRQRTVLNNMFLPMYGSTSTNRMFDFDDPSPTSANDANDELTAKTNALVALVVAGFNASEACQVVGLPEMSWTMPPKLLAAVTAADGDAPAAITSGGQGGPNEAGPAQVNSPAELTGPDPMNRTRSIDAELSDMLIMEYAGVIRNSFEVRQCGRELV
jgi:HK97 family phage portal protein